MKKLLFVLALQAVCFYGFTQSKNSEWYLSAGLNIINDLGTRSPINSPNEWSFNKLPISVAAEFSWGKQFSVEQSITYNAFSTKNEIGNEDDLKLKLNYLSYDTYIKYYCGQHLFPNTDWLDLYLNAGVGFFNIDKTNISTNLGGGVLFWLNESKNFGIRLQTIAKFAHNHAKSGLNNNHYQYHLQAIIKL